MTLRRPLLPIILALLVGALTSCGDDGVQKVAESEGTYATVGSVQYQVQTSRQLNPTNIEDRDYLSGLAQGEQNLEADELWFGVFIRAKNLTDVPLDTAEEFTLEDTIGEEFERIEAENVVDYKPLVLESGEASPNTNELSSYGPGQGKMLLFKLKNATLDNRPLEMKIVSPDGDEGTIEIDV